MKSLNVVHNTIFLLLLSSCAFASHVGRYCELEGAETSSGEEIIGECYMYSDVYGELEGAETESGLEVTGECYRYSNDYAELESAETEGGEDVSGECYFY